MSSHGRGVRASRLAAARLLGLGIRADGGPTAAGLATPGLQALAGGNPGDDQACYGSAMLHSVALSTSPTSRTAER